jgi:hypothetical protein
MCCAQRFALWLIGHIWPILLYNRSSLRDRAYITPVLRHGWDDFQFTLQRYYIFLIYTKKIALAGAIFLSGAWCSISYSL